MTRTDDDAALLSVELDGSQSFWAGRPRSSCPFEGREEERRIWLAQWDGSAGEARIVALANRSLLFNVRTVRAALEETLGTLGRVRRNIAKIPGGLKFDIENSERLLKSALEFFSRDPAGTPGGARGDI